MLLHQTTRPCMNQETTMSPRTSLYLLTACLLLLPAFAGADEVGDAERLLCTSVKVTECYSCAVQATATQVENFKKAFSVCLEAKDYMVKY